MRIGSYPADRSPTEHGAAEVAELSLSILLKFTIEALSTFELSRQ